GAPAFGGPGFDSQLESSGIRYDCLRGSSGFGCLIMLRLLIMTAYVEVLALNSYYVQLTYMDFQDLPQHQDMVEERPDQDPTWSCMVKGALEGNFEIQELVAEVQADREAHIDVHDATVERLKLVNEVYSDREVHVVAPEVNLQGPDLVAEVVEKVLNIRYEVKQIEKVDKVPEQFVNIDAENVSPMADVCHSKDAMFDQYEVKEFVAEDFC
ncbi:hypothetical protein Tco_1395297, partial [Tanacetum coccineum]